jgi:hypothetical protein
MARRIGFGRRICIAWGCLSFFATPRVVHGADDGLAALVHVHMLNDDALLAAAPKPNKSFHLRRICTKELVADRAKAFTYS